MRWLGLSPLAFAIGLAALAALAFALHLLRVRLRRVEVDTLLFFPADVPDPERRELIGRPSRWPSLLLALLLVTALWTVFAELRIDRAAPSAAVVLCASGSEALPYADAPGRRLDAL